MTPPDAVFFTSKREQGWQTSPGKKIRPGSANPPGLYFVLVSLPHHGHKYKL